MNERRSLTPILLAVALTSLSLILFELLLTRLFAVVLFAQFAHLALALALLGVSVGAVAQHLWPGIIPRQGAERRLGWLILLLALAVVGAVFAVMHFPVLKASATLTRDFQDRSSIKDQLLNPGWFFALMPCLALPFALGGLAFSGLFQRLKDSIGRIYGADLVGGAVGAVLFLPVLGALAGPDTLFVITLSAGLGAFFAFRAARSRLGQGLGFALMLLSCGGMAVSASTGELVRIRQAAGYDESAITDVHWTPLTRLCLYEAYGKVKLLLDNTSASEVVRTEADLKEVDACQARSLVYRLEANSGGTPPALARVAVLGASAGPEVAVAQALGFRDIDAVDIASEGFDIVAEKFPNAPLNPYLKPGVRKVHADGRAAVLQARVPYDVIQMVHANLWSSAGLISNAWSPALIETREAFATYLDRLTPGGMISFARGEMTIYEIRAAYAALRERGAASPWKHIAWIRGNCEVMLVRNRPWSEQEHDVLLSTLAGYRQATLALDPLDEQSGKMERKSILGRALMTDNRPYLDSPRMVTNAFRDLFGKATGKADSPMAVLYQSVVLQVGFVLAAGLAFVLVPWIWRGRSEMSGLKGGIGVLAYVAGLGYGYLAVETVLIHQLVIFVGHPTYAVTVVVLAMLLGSGLGSMFSGRLATQDLLVRLRIVLAVVVLLGIVQAFVVPRLLENFALGLPIGLRLALTFACVFPLGFVMGMPFPLGLRLLPQGTEGIVPWAWAINGWMSVAASLTTVLVSRIYGYSQAFGFAILAYALCILLAGRLTRLSRPQSV
jgi:hypothetical protein